jgi:hypothetical protein
LGAVQPPFAKGLGSRKPLYGAVDVVLKQKDISEGSKRKLLVDNTARFYGL